MSEIPLLRIPCPEKSYYDPAPCGACDVIRERCSLCNCEDECEKHTEGMGQDE